MKASQNKHLQQDHITQLQTLNALQAEQIAALKQQLDWFQRQLFGQKSEKQQIDMSHQNNLFESNDNVPDEPAPEMDVQAHKRKSHTQYNGNEVNDSGLRFDETVPRQFIDLPAPELQGEDADQYEIIDYKETSRLAQQPGSYTVITYRRPVVRHKTNQTLSTIAAPDNVLDGCYADVSLLAGMMVDKAVYHLPLYRQHQRMLDSGVQVSRATLTNWIQKGIELLRPIYVAMHKHILQSKVLAMDEVGMKAGRKTKGKMKQTYFWPMYGDSDEVAFTWSESRGRKHAIEQLKGFTGTLLTDGYPTYKTIVTALNKTEVNIKHATCWAHSRRKFESLLGAFPVEAQHALDRIAGLYKIEKHIREKSFDAEQAFTYRQKYSEPIVQAFFKWVYDQRQRVDIKPSEPLSVALAYVAKLQPELKQFLCNPHVQLDTNHLERSLRVIPMGRKNHLFCWTELGAEQLGILHSLTVTCRIHGINPYTYLVDVLQRVALHPAKDAIDLTPRVWKTKFKDNIFSSDLANMG